GKSGECPEPSAIDDGRECLEEGECFRGRCLTFCERPAINKKPCICPNGTFAMDIADSCLRCCRSSNGTCEPFARSEKYILRDGTRCIHGHCQNVSSSSSFASHHPHMLEYLEMDHVESHSQSQRNEKRLPLKENIKDKAEISLRIMKFLIHSYLFERGADLIKQ
uniref:ADAM17 membrane-proximal domain-containing protein n=1 Tax=Parascaris equorum TaxID=6256 RepID=A0A914RZR6_PAREQ